MTRFTNFFTMARRSVALAATAVLACVVGGLAGGNAHAQSAQAPLVQPQDLVYEGAFLVPFASQPVQGDMFSFNGGGHSLAYRPETNTLLLSGSRCCLTTVAEITIPDIRMSTVLGALDRATYVQPHADPLQGRTPDIGCGGPVSGLLPFAGSLVLTAHCSYDGDFQQIRSHWRTSTLALAAPGHTPGPVEVQSPTTGGGRAGFVSGWMAPIPPEWQAALGGPALTGNCCVSVITRTSFGPAASVFNPLDIGVREPVPATSLVGYTADHPLEPNGACDVQSHLFNCATAISGLTFPNGTRSVLFFGMQGVGDFCYGSVTGDPALHQQPIEGEPGVVWCYDPAGLNGKGPHAFPYQHYIWAYDANDLARVKSGLMNWYDVRPYAVWSFETPFQTLQRDVRGVAFDPSTRRLFVSIGEQDGPRPVIHVFRVTAGATTSTDTAAPSVALSSPAPSTSVTGTVSFSATASDNTGVAGVWFTVDGVTVGPEDHTAPYELSWNSSSFPNGSHVVRAHARDAAGNTGSSTISTVSITNAIVDTMPPSVLMTSPAAGSSVSGAVMVAANATDNVGVVRVDFKVNGVVVGTDTVAPFSASWDTAGYPPGGYNLTATAADAVGNAHTSTVMTVLVVGPPDSTAPTVSISSPAAGTTVSGTATVLALATDNVGVAGVRFAVDGLSVGNEDLTAPYQFAWNTASLANGPHNVVAIARDAAGNITMSSAVWVTVGNGPVDTTPPTVSVSSPVGGATVAGTVTVATQVADNVGVAGVRFTVDGVATSAGEVGPPFQFSWNTTGLANGPHYVNAVARDASGNLATSAAVWVMVTNDSTPPTAAITAPIAGSTVSGIVTVTAQVSDDIGVAGVRFLLDGVASGAEDVTAPYQFSWSTTGLAGPHYVQAVARDRAGNTSTSSAVWVSVDNSSTIDSTAPLVSLTNPLPGSTVSGRMTLIATASDNVGVRGVQFLVDGVNVGSEDTAAPYSYSWSTISTSNGPHTISAIARDATGNQTTAAGVSVTVNNITSDTTPPTVTLTAPSPSGTLNGAVTLAATASDSSGIASVRFTVDGVAVGAAVTTAPYTTVWQSAQVANGFHAVRAIARDTAGNEQTTAAVNVYVSNTVVADQIAPVVAFVSPANGATISGNATLEVTATDNVGVVGVQFAIDGVNMGPENVTAPYQYLWRTQTTAARSYVLRATARDAAGNTASASITVTVRNTPRRSSGTVSENRTGLEEWHGLARPTRHGGQPAARVNPLWAVDRRTARSLPPSVSPSRHAVG